MYKATDRKNNDIFVIKIQFRAIWVPSKPDGTLSTIKVLLSKLIFSDFVFISDFLAFKKQYVVNLFYFILKAKFKLTVHN